MPNDIKIGKPSDPYSIILVALLMISDAPPGRVHGGGWQERVTTPPRCPSLGSLGSDIPRPLGHGQGLGKWGVPGSEGPPNAGSAQMFAARSGAFRAVGFVSVGKVPLTVQLHTKKLHVDPDWFLFPERDRGMAHHFPFSTFPKPRTKGARIP